MSIKNYNKVLVIKDLTRGNTEVIHDYYKYNDELKSLILFQRLKNYIEENQDFAVSYMYDSQMFDLGLKSA